MSCGAYQENEVLNETKFKEWAIGSFWRYGDKPYLIIGVKQLND